MKNKEVSEKKKVGGWQKKTQHSNQHLFLPSAIIKLKSNKQFIRPNLLDALELG